MNYQPRMYRDKMLAKGLTRFEVVESETDLWVSASRDLSAETRAVVLEVRAEIEGYIAKDALFATTFAPHRVPDSAPEIVRTMAAAAIAAGVGPMAAVAGAVAEAVGRRLAELSPEVIVENGGDIFMKTTTKRTVAIFAGESSLSYKVGLVVQPGQTPVGVCTSSGTVGHSTSLGHADAAICLSANTALADAAATALGNKVHNADDIEPALKFAQGIEGIAGVVVVVGDKMGAAGDVELVPIPGR